MADRIELTSRSYVDTAVGVAVDALAGEAPDALNTIVELAAALQDDTLANALNNAIAGKQPTSTVLTALAALSTTDFGVALLTLAGAGALREAAGLGDASTHDASDFDPAGAAATAQAASQPWDADLAAIALLTTTTFGRSLLTMANAAAVLSALGGVAATSGAAFDQTGNSTVATTVPADVNVGTLSALDVPGIITAIGTIQTAVNVNRHLLNKNIDVLQGAGLAT